MQPAPATLTEEDMPEVVKLLQGESRAARFHALEILFRATISSGALAIADLVLNLFEHDPDPEVRLRAANVLGKLPYTPQSARALFAALGEPNETIRQYVSLVLPTDVCCVPELINALKNSDPLVRIGVAVRLSFEPLDPAITQALISALSDPDFRVRSSAAQSIGNHETRITEAESALICALKDPDHSVSFAAAKSLRQIPGGNTEANRVFDEVIQRDLADPNRRLGALMELSHLHFIDVKYAEQLRELLNDSTLSSMAAKAIAKIGPPVDNEIPYLKRWLLSGKDILESAKSPVHDPEIFDWLTDQLLSSYPHHCVPYTAAMALACFGKDGVPYLIKGLAWDDGIAQTAAVKALETIGNDAVSALPELLQAVRNGRGQSDLRDNSGETDMREQTRIVNLLAKIAPDEERVLACLGALASDPLDARQDAAMAALKTIGTDRALDLVRRAGDRKKGTD
jgi:HEAT repeat protein